MNGEIRSSMNDIKGKPAYECPQCGFSGLFKSEKCVRCGVWLVNEVIDELS